MPRRLKTDAAGDGVSAATPGIYENSINRIFVCILLYPPVKL
jgi:hypothetical protein